MDAFLVWFEHLPLKMSVHVPEMEHLFHCRHLFKCCTDVPGWDSAKEPARLPRSCAEYLYWNRSLHCPNPGTTWASGKGRQSMLFNIILLDKWHIVWIRPAFTMFFPMTINTSNVWYGFWITDWQTLLNKMLYNFVMSSPVLSFHSWHLIRVSVCCMTLTGGTLAPLSFSGGGAHLHPVDVVAMVPRKSKVPADWEAQRPCHHHRSVSWRRCTLRRTDNQIKPIKLQ